MPAFWSYPLFLDLFMYYCFIKMVTEKSPVKWSYPLFLESAKLEFHCTTKTPDSDQMLYCVDQIKIRRQSFDLTEISTTCNAGW